LICNKDKVSHVIALNRRQKTHTHTKLELQEIKCSRFIISHFQFTYKWVNVYVYMLYSISCTM